MALLGKILLSIIVYFFITVFAALMFGGPIDPRKNKKLVEIRQSVLYFGSLLLAFYGIWFY